MPGGVRRRAILAGALGLLVGSAFGCARARTLVIEVSPEVNQGFAVAFDLVIAHNPQLAEDLGKLSAAEFNSSRPSLEARYGTQLEVHSCEWPPGIRVPPWKLPPVNNRVAKRKRKSKRADKQRYGTFVFAHYPSPREHRRQIDGLLVDHETVLIELSADEIHVSAGVAQVAGVGGYPCTAEPTEDPQ